MFGLLWERDPVQVSQRDSPSLHVHWGSGNSSSGEFQNNGLEELGDPQGHLLCRDLRVQLHVHLTEKGTE